MGTLGSLVVVGTGIMAVGQVTKEAVAHLRKATKLFFLSADRITTQWLLDLNSSAESLEGCYRGWRIRKQTYEEIVEKILSPIRAGQEVCLALYGHPGICAYPGHAAVKRARAEGFRARMLPGVSCADCLFADLGIDPALHGIQMYECSDFLRRRRLIDPSSGLLLLQVGMLGQSYYVEKYSTAALPLLAEVLVPLYGEQHEVILYEAAQHAINEPAIHTVALARLPQAPVEPATTLYVPPLPVELDSEMSDRLTALFPQGNSDV